MMRQAVRLNSLSELSITKLDMLDTFEKIKVCVAYDVEGKRYEHLPYHQSALHKAKAVYEEMPGWKTDISEATELHHLPAAAKEFIGFLAEQSGVPIKLVGLGPGREQFVSF
jgi:adenylosuccinate synthase